MKKLVTNALVALTIFPLIAACGKKSSGGGSGSSGNGNDTPRTEIEIEEEGAVDGSTIDGIYKAKFITLNSQVNGTIPGSLTLFRDGDRLLTYIRLFAGKPEAWHMQGIYMGKRCPDASDDKNNDGFIDIEEALTVVEDLIVPLDANMNSQAAGKNFYPLADLSGYYHYEREASFERLFNDLRAEDKDPNDHIAKLAPDEKFAFQGRAVLIQGVTEDTLLPETVVSMGRRRPFQTLPISCGIIAKADEVPGVPYDGEIPGPIAPVVDDQDRPAPPEEDTTGTAAGGTIAGTTGTNENEEGEVGNQGGAEGGTAAGTNGETTSGTTGGRRGGFIGGFIGGRNNGETTGETGTTAGTTSGTPTGTPSGTTGTTGTGETGETGESEESRGGFIGGFISGSESGSRRSSSSSSSRSSSRSWRRSSSSSSSSSSNG